MNYTFGQVHFFVHRGILTKIEFCVEENVLYLIKRKNSTISYANFKLVSFKMNTVNLVHVHACLPKVFKNMH